MILIDTGLSPHHQAADTSQPVLPMTSPLHDGTSPPTLNILPPPVHTTT